MKVYIAHPISGLTGPEVIDYFLSEKVYLESIGLEVLHPMTGKGYLRTEKKYKAHGYHYPVSTNHAISERDCWMVQQADIVVVDLTGATDISIGCMMELAWASLLRKHTLVVMEPGNVHQHAFVIEAADIIFDCMGECITYLKNLSHGSA